MSRKAKSKRKTPRGDQVETRTSHVVAAPRAAWTAAGAARAARDARIATAAHLRGAAIAQEWEISQLAAGYQVLGRHLRATSGALRFLLGRRRLDESAAAILFGGAGLAPPFPTTLDDGARAVLDRRAADLDAATLYVLSPQMCDVVVAAAQTLTVDDIALLDHEDLPSPTGMLMLPHPVIVRAVNGSLADHRAYVWTTPAESRISPAWRRRTMPPRPGVRYTAYYDAHGPVRPDSFRDMAALAAAQRTPLPPLVPDATQTFPFRLTLTDRQRESIDHLAGHARAAADDLRELHDSVGLNTGDQVIASFEYQPGDELDDRDDLFTLRFLYAFCRLCEQNIVELGDAPTNHSAQVVADRAGVPAEVRVATLRTIRRPGSGYQAAETGSTNGWCACTRSASGIHP
jgi:hypothetical protein